MWAALPPEADLGACSCRDAGDRARLFVRRWKPRKDDLRG